MRVWLIALFTVLCSTVATAAELTPEELHEAALESLLQGPLDDAKAKQEEKKAEKDSEAEARLKALEEARKGKNPRVVVLQWKDTDTNYETETLQRNIKTRIARPDAQFFPSIDLYQVGRREPRRDIRPFDERAMVPDDVISIMQNAVQDIETVPWNAMSESDWGITANTLRSIAEETVWFIDRPDLRGPLFHLYVQIGRAAENQNNSTPPYYESVGGMAVNYYWYLAGAMAHEEPSLMSEVSNQDMFASIDYYKQMLDNGTIRKMTTSFAQADKFDVKEFATEFKVFVNGIERLIDNDNGFVEVPPGRIDVYLARGDDAHSLSDRLSITKLEDKIYFVRDVAKKRMGLDLIDQLMEHPNECTPEIDAEALHYITIYAKLHPEGEIYVAVPEAGNANKILLWRYDRNTGTLQKVLDDIGSYPIHFTALGGIGATFNGAGYNLEDADGNSPTQESLDAFELCLAEPGALPSDCADAQSLSLTPEFSPSGIPLQAELRVHYSRFFVGFGAQTSPWLGDDEAPDQTKWQEKYQISNGEAQDDNGNAVFKEVTFNRLIYTSLGFIIMKDANLGIGPRAYMRVGWMNAPHIMDVTAHAGLTIEPPGMEQEGRRRLVIDTDLFLGAAVPFGDTVLEGTGASLNFGISAGGGLVF